MTAHISAIGIPEHAGTVDVGDVLASTLTKGGTVIHLESTVRLPPSETGRELSSTRSECGKGGSCPVTFAGVAALFATSYEQRRYTPGSVGELAAAGYQDCEPLLCRSCNWPNLVGTGWAQMRWLDDTVKALAAVRPDSVPERTTAR